MNHLLEVYIELYKRSQYSSIPLGQYPTGEYFYPTIKQIETLELLNNKETSFVGYGGSARSGKSLIECTAIVLECLAYDGIAWGLGRKELTTLKRTVLLTLFKQLEFYGMNDGDYNYNQQLNRIDFNNGSTIFLIDTAYKPSDPLNTRFGGFELTRCAVDESNETNEDVIIKLYERTGWRHNDTYGLKRKVFECFNPAKNHVYKRYYKPFRDGAQGMFKRFIAALPSDNPHPSVKEWIEDIIKTGDTVTIERQVNGNFDYDDDPRALCDFDAISDLFTNEHIQGGKGYISADLAMKGRDKFIGGYWSGMVCNVSIDMDKSSAREIELKLKELKIVKNVGNSNIVADADGLGAYLESYIKNIKTFHGGSSAVDKLKYGNLKDECAYKLAEFINKRMMRIICSPDQEERIKEELSICLKAESLTIDKKKIIKKDAMKVLLGRSPDYLDMLLMKMVFHIKPKLKAPKVTVYD
jgi:phage terminase large subunit